MDKTTIRKNKSKAKHLARKAEKQRLATSRAAVDKANALKDPLEPFSAFRKYDRNGVTCNLFMQKGTELSEELKSWVFDLTRRNMQSIYEASAWGWNDKAKLDELTSYSSWFLIAQTPEGAPIGFSHFRFDLDEDLEVLYCYELQLESNVKRKGLGKFMMQVLELIAFKNNMCKVVLTILKNNSDSTFFKSLNYVLDETSPVDDGEEVFCYEILSKLNKSLVNRKSLQCCENLL